MSDITVVISTSARPSHPDTRIIDKTIASVRNELPNAPIVVSCDGPKVDANIEGADVVSRWLTHEHQSGMIGPVLREHVATPLLLYVEDDWELIGEIPWRELSALVLSGELNYIKLHAYPRINPYHEHLMLERVMYQNGVLDDRYHDNRLGEPIPIIKTRQWSQNPHLASTKFYREQVLPRCQGKCDFIENIMHGVVGHSPWSEFKCGIYNPAGGDMMRCRHLDGKGSK